MPMVNGKETTRPLKEAYDAVDPAPFQKMAKKAEHHVDSPGIDRCCIGADLHRFIREKVSPDYNVPAGLNREPLETIEKGGNCVDYSVLFSSLLRAANLRCRLITVTSTDQAHMFVQILFKASRQRIQNDLKEYYRRVDRVRRLSIMSSEDEKGRGIWVTSDPMGTRTLGDPSGLKRMGYLKEERDGSLQFLGDLHFVEVRKSVRRPHPNTCFQESYAVA